MCNKLDQKQNKVINFYGATNILRHNKVYIQNCHKKYVQYSLLFLWSQTDATVVCFLLLVINKM